MSTTIKQRRREATSWRQWCSVYFQSANNPLELIRERAVERLASTEMNYLPSIAWNICNLITEILRYKFPTPTRRIILCTIKIPSILLLQISRNLRFMRDCAKLRLNLYSIRKVKCRKGGFPGRKSYLLLCKLQPLCSDTMVEPEMVAAETSVSGSGSGFTANHKRSFFPHIWAISLLYDAAVCISRSFVVKYAREYSQSLWVGNSWCFVFFCCVIPLSFLLNYTHHLEKHFIPALKHSRKGFSRH